MNKILIESKNDKATNALREQIEKANFVQSRAAQQWYCFTKMSEKPYVIKVTIKTPLLKPNIVAAQIEDILDEMGLKKDVDYTLKVVTCE